MPIVEWIPETEVAERIEAAVLAEREACAKVCEKMPAYIDRHNALIQASATSCAAAIRARSNK